MTRASRPRPAASREQADTVPPSRRARRNPEKDRQIALWERIRSAMMKDFQEVKRGALSSFSKF